MEDRQRLPIEELTNCLTHGAGLFLSIIGSAVLIALAISNGNVLHVVTAAIYCTTLILLYGASTLYHASRSPRYKGFLQALDHCAIYLLIAGTYTPFTLVILGNGWGWLLCSVVWSLAVSCIIVRVLAADRFRSISAASYLTLGWLSLVAIRPIITLLPLTAVILLVLGGVTYTLGVIFLGASRIPHHHAIWHLFVLAGSICHYIVVVLYVIPAGAVRV